MHIQIQQSITKTHKTIMQQTIIPLFYVCDCLQVWENSHILVCLNIRLNYHTGWQTGLVFPLLKQVILNNRSVVVGK